MMKIKRKEMRIRIKLTQPNRFSKTKESTKTLLMEHTNLLESIWQMNSL